MPSVRINLYQEFENRLLPFPEMAEAKADLKSVLRSIPKFDGKSNADLFCARCDAVLASENVSSRWLLLNFHLVIEGEVQDWWKWTQIRFIKDLNDQNKDAKWIELKNALKAFYEPESVRKEARKISRSIRFTDCSSAGEYVSRKLSYFGVMNPEMSDQKQVDKLIKGLPESLRNIMYCSEPRNATEFLQRLRKMDRPDTKKNAEKSSRVQIPVKPEIKKSVGAFPSSSDIEKPSSSGSETRSCFYCKEAGHIIKNCPTRPPKRDKSSVYEISVDTTTEVVETKNQ